MASTWTVSHQLMKSLARVAKDMDIRIQVDHDYASLNAFARSLLFVSEVNLQLWCVCVTFFTYNNGVVLTDIQTKVSL